MSPVLKQQFTVLQLIERKKMSQQLLQTNGFQDPASTAMFADSVSLITGEE